LFKINGIIWIKKMKNNFKIALCQMKVVDDKRTNLEKATTMIETAARNGTEMVVLPEMFNCPYDTNKFKAYAEPPENSPSLKLVSSIAKENGVFLIAGSIPELSENKLYNSSFIYNNHGILLGVHRKIHLFDIDIPGEITFKESETISAGNNVTVVDTDLMKIGVAICYDVRFPELFRLMILNGAGLIAVPGAFNPKTGPAHWETIIRARAIDNQAYMIAASPARNKDLSYHAYGHSMVVDPWGKVIAMAGEGEEIVYATIDGSYIEKIRTELPILKNRRTDIYDLIERYPKRK
jgi:predicted amidohydrolase